MTAIRPPPGPPPVGPPRRAGAGPTAGPGGRGVGTGRRAGPHHGGDRLAAEIARRRRRTILVDADPYGGAVAQQLGILDEVSGLLAAARLAAAGQLEERLASVQRGLDDHLSVVTGLPRADRWVEVRAGSVEHLLELAREQGEVVVDTGFSLEDDPGSDFGVAPRAQPADPGRAGGRRRGDRRRVAPTRSGCPGWRRALVELRDLTGARPVHVVVNRMRPTLGWSERDIAGMVSGFARVAGLHFLPDDQAAVDRALVAGRTLVEVGDSPFGRAIARVADALAPVPV